MRIDPTQHLARPLLVHRLAADFSLLDVWRLPAQSARPEDSFERFVRSFPLLGGDAAQKSTRVVRWLFLVRTVLLRAFGVDDDTSHSYPIPGCQETSLRERLSPDERARFEVPLSARGESLFVPLYATPDERAYEVSNATVHAVLHLTWVDEGATRRAYMAVYAKARGVFGKLYMALISPFRHYIVYPALMKSTERAWQRAVAG